MMEYVQRSFFNSIINQLSHIYTDSQYNQDCDLFRMKDIMDSVSEGQFESKLWLLQHLQPLITDKHSGIQIIGGWYGLMSHLIAYSGFDREIKNYDLDPVCEEYGYKLRQYDNIHFSTEDGLDVYNKDHRGFNEYLDPLGGTRNNTSSKITICTACEHIDREDLSDALKKKHPDQLVALQSNNYFEIDSHINCHDGVDHFISTLPLNDILYSGSLPWRDEYDRFMVIGR